MLYTNLKLLCETKNVIQPGSKITVQWMKILHKCVFMIDINKIKQYQRIFNKFANFCYATNVRRIRVTAALANGNILNFKQILVCAKVNYSTKCSHVEPPIGRHLFHKDTEEGINKQIAVEFGACLAYLSMACYFGRTDVALPGCQAFFIYMHKEEHEHALTLIKYQNMRGGHVCLYEICTPENQVWNCVHDALEVSLKMEKSVKEKIVELCLIARKHKDLHLQNYLQTKFIHEQERSICELARLINRSSFMGTSGTAVYLFDKMLYKNFGRKGVEKSEHFPEIYI